jgi:hypothetical protein
MKSRMYLLFTIPLFTIIFNLYFNFVFIIHIFVSNMINFHILFNHSITNQLGTHHDDKVQIPNLDFCIFFVRLI